MTQKIANWASKRRTLAARNFSQSVSLAIALAIMISSISMIIPTNATASIFTDIEGPDVTFKDVLWHEEQDVAIAVGNDSVGNGVAYRYSADQELWSEVLNVSGDSYNAVTKTEPYIWPDLVESGENGWTTSTWDADASISSLVSEWKFEDGIGTNVNDTSGNGHFGTLDPLMDNSNWVDGMSGKALEFHSAEANEELIIPDVAGLTEGSFSGDCWVNLTTHQSYGGIVNKYGGGGWGIWDQSGGEIRFYLYDGSTTTSANSAPISTGEWHHLAWSYNETSGMISFYIDGDLDYSTASVNPTRHVTPIEIGSRGNTNWLDGKIDEVRIFNRVLTLKEISDYYNDTVYKVGEWKLDEGTGKFTNDTGPNNYIGTLRPTYPTSNPHWSDEAISGKALYFDGGDDRVETDYLPNTFNLHDHTVEAWVYPTQTKTNSVIYGIGEQTVNGKILELKIDNDEIEVWHWGWNWYTGVYVNNNEWTHISYSYTTANKTGYLYVNGQYQGSFVFGGYLNVQNDLNNPSQIGMSVSGRVFKGYIDEVSIYNYSRPGYLTTRDYNEDLSHYYSSQTLMGDWRFEDGGGGIATDDSQYERDGTLGPFPPSTTPTWTEGRIGGGLYFDGVNNVHTGYIPNTFNNHDLTLEAWVNPDAATADLIIYGIGDENNPGQCFEIKLNLGELEVWHWNDNWENTGIYPTTGEWSHIAYVYQSSTWTGMLYLNGAPVGTYSFANPLNIQDDSYISGQIGAGYPDRYFRGYIDEFKIWNRMLNDTEILESYRSAFTPAWQIVNPSTLPVPGSGIDHGSANSPSNIWWFGHNETGSYDNGAKVSGSLISPAVQLPSISLWGAIVMSHWFDIEDIGPNADVMTLSIKNTTDSDWYPLKIWDSDTTPISNWTQDIIGITPWLGNQVQINFTFDSIDEDLNDYGGWHLDDIVFYTSEAYIVVGEIPTGLGYSAYAGDISGSFSHIAGMKSISFNDVAGGNIPATFVAVGDNGKARYWNNGAWISLSGMNLDDTLTGVDFDGNNFIIVGYDISNNGVVYYITEANLYGGSTILTPTPWAPSVKLNAIAWHNYVNGGLVCAEGAMYFLNSTWEWKGPIGIDASMNYTAASWDPQGLRAIIVGNTGTGSAAFDIYAGNTEITRIPDYDNIFLNHKLYGAAYQEKLTGDVEVLLVGASAFSISPKAFAQNTQILVNVDYPRIFDVDFFKTSDPGTSLVNKQVDVQETYTFRTEVNYTQGATDQLFDGINNTAIDLMVWFDDSGVNEMTLPGMDDVHRTRYFNVTWFEGDGGANVENAIVTYPINSPGTDEFQLVGFGSGPVAGDHWWIELEIYFGPQTRAADGQGFANGDSTNESDIFQSFTDPDSWNFMMEIYDTTFTTASSKGYEEFGVFKYTNITVSGNPSGNSPPGTSDNAIGSSTVTFSANVPYYVNVSIPDLARVGGGGSIAATYIAASSASPLANNTNCGMNSTWIYGKPFPGAYQNLSVWGNTSQPFTDWYVPAPDNGTAAHGPWGSDFNANGATIVDWFASVPGGTGEGIYRATITFKIGYY